MGKDIALNHTSRNINFNPKFLLFTESEGNIQT